MEYEIEIYLFIQLNGTVWSNFQNVLGSQLWDDIGEIFSKFTWTIQELLKKWLAIKILKFECPKFF